MASAPDASLPAENDSALMLRVQRADEIAFAELMRRWELPVKSVIARIVLNRSEAEDLAQETFVRLWQQRARYAPDRPLKPWLLGIAVNLARNRLRWWRRRPVVALDDWMPVLPAPGAAAEGAGSLEAGERARAVQEAIAALPADQREAIVLFEFEHLSYAEIALATNSPVKTIENRIARGREKLRNRLRAWH